MSSNIKLLQHDKQLIEDLSCSNYLAFETKLMKIRKFDDTIVNILNAEIPTESFYKKNPSLKPTGKCQQLANEMREYYDLRENKIKSCVSQCEKEVNDLRQDPNASPAALRDKSFLLRLYKQEQQVEEIHRTRSERAVEEKCRAYI